MLTTTSIPSDRFRDAMKGIRKLGHKARTNVASCCSGCVTAEQLNYDPDSGQTLVWSFRGQGRSTDDLNEGEVLYLNHNNLTATTFVEIEEEFALNDLVATWDGEEYSCVQVFDVQRRYKAVEARYTPSRWNEELDRYRRQTADLREADRLAKEAVEYSDLIAELQGMTVQQLREAVTAGRKAAPRVYRHKSRWHRRY